MSRYAVRDFERGPPSARALRSGGPAATGHPPAPCPRGQADSLSARTDVQAPRHTADVSSAVGFSAKTLFIVFCPTSG